MPRAKSKTADKKRNSPRKYWSAAVMQRSDALDLEPHIFASSDPRVIALSLKRSAERSRRRKSGPYQSAMSMLNFYLNRAGRNLPAARKRSLNRAKDELRKLYDRPAPRTGRAKGSTAPRKRRRA